MKSKEDFVTVHLCEERNKINKKNDFSARSILLEWLHTSFERGRMVRFSIKNRPLSLRFSPVFESLYNLLIEPEIFTHIQLIGTFWEDFDRNWRYESNGLWIGWLFWNVQLMFNYFKLRNTPKIFPAYGFVVDVKLCPWNFFDHF